MRSRLTLSKLASAASIARRASSAPWMRPSAASMRVVEALHADRQAVHARGAEAAEARRLERAGIRFQRDLGARARAAGARARRRAARRSTRGENRLGVPPPMNTLTTRRPQTDGSAPSRSASSARRTPPRAARRALVRVEVAVRALAHAPRDVDVERERRQRASFRCRAFRRRHSRSSSSFARARCPRWLTRFFSPGRARRRSCSSSGMKKSGS